MQMLTYFKHKGFEPSATVQDAAEKAMAQITSTHSNPDATIVARVEFDGQRYGCSFDVFRRFGSLYVFITDADPVLAILNATGAMINKLDHADSTPNPDYLNFVHRRSKENCYQ